MNKLKLYAVVAGMKAFEIGFRATVFVASPALWVWEKYLYWKYDR